MVGSADEELRLAGSFEQPEQRAWEVALEGLPDEQIVLEVVHQPSRPPSREKLEQGRAQGRDVHEAVDEIVAADSEQVADAPYETPRHAGDLGQRMTVLVGHPPQACAHVGRDVDLPAAAAPVVIILLELQSLAGGN